MRNIYENVWSIQCDQISSLASRLEGLGIEKMFFFFLLCLLILFFYSFLSISHKRVHNALCFVTLIRFTNHSYIQLLCKLCVHWLCHGQGIMKFCRKCLHIEFHLSKIARVWQVKPGCRKHSWFHQFYEESMYHIRTVVLVSSDGKVSDC